MFIDRNRLVELNKNIFGGGINQTKKLVPDYGRCVMPDPSLPKIKRYNIKSNNPLGYLMNTNQQMMQSQASQNFPSQNIIDQPEQDIYSHNMEQSQHIDDDIPVTQTGVVGIDSEPKKYVITDLGENNISLPQGFSTDDEGQFKLINLINEPKENYTLADESEYGKIYKREVRIDIYLIII